MISAERLRELHGNLPEVLIKVVPSAAKDIEKVFDDLEAARARIAELEAACKALYADAHGDGFDSGPSFVPQGLSQQDRDACNAGSMAAIQLSKIQPSKLQSEGWVEVAAILRRLGGQTT